MVDREQLQYLYALASEFVKENVALVLVACFVITALQLYILIRVRQEIRRPWLDPNNFQPLMLAVKKQLTHNTVLLRFDLPRRDQHLGLPVGQHITFLAKDADGKDVYRPYTPTTDCDTRGRLEFVIKLYPQGKMSQIIHRMQVGEDMLMKGPRGKFTYEPNTKKHIGMLAGGSGITPMYQVLQAILKNKNDKTKVTLLYANVTEGDILLRDELDEASLEHKSRFKVFYILNQPPADWRSAVGFITPDLIRAYLAPPSGGDNVLILRCGPPGMMDAMKSHMDDLGYAETQQFQF